MPRFFARLKRGPAPDLGTTRSRCLRLVLVLAIGMLGLVGTLGVGLVTAVPAGAATTLFVSGSTGSDNNPCSAIGPCKTISHALSLAGSGATIEVAGTVDDAVSVSTTVTIEQWPGRAAAVVDATGLRKSVFAVSSGASVTLQGLTVTGGAAEGGGLSNRRQRHGHRYHDHREHHGGRRAGRRHCQQRHSHGQRHLHRRQPGIGHLPRGWRPL